MHRPSAQEFLQTLLESLDDLPPDLRTTFRGDAEAVRVRSARRRIRQLFEELAGD